MNSRPTNRLSDGRTLLYSPRLLHLVLGRLAHLYHSWTTISIPKISSVISNEPVLLVHPFPVIVEFPCLLLLNVEVVMSFLNVVSAFLLDNLPTLIV